MTVRPILSVLCILTVAQVLCGIGRCGRETPDEVPDMTGTWELAVDSTFDVDIDIGGSVYNGTLGAGGGTIEVEHDSETLEFDLDCTRQAVVCPHEVFPEAVEVEHRINPDRFDVSVFEQDCNGDMVDPDPSECGEDTVKQFVKPRHLQRCCAELRLRL